MVHQCCSSAAYHSPTPITRPTHIAIINTPHLVLLELAFNAIHCTVPRRQLRPQLRCLCPRSPPGLPCFHTRLCRYRLCTLLLLDSPIQLALHLLNCLFHLFALRFVFLPKRGHVCACSVQRTAEYWQLAKLRGALCDVGKLLGEFTLPCSGFLQSPRAFLGLRASTTAAGTRVG